MPTPPDDRLDDLRGPLPAGQPYVYLSRAQASALRGPARGLAAYLPHLPCWVPQRRVADALGFDHSGIERCLERGGGAPYLWATELENVHSLWRYDEPALTIDGRVYADSEAYYHAQKPRPFDAARWEAARVGVMRRALAHKLAARPALGGLLRSTHPHPLLALKEDAFWGVRRDGVGENMLARLWMELRASTGT
ncbi:MAG: NADAR family protein [Myxococcales bacterium]|nr:NADAR family protein [Myxococcales bacterium]